jgi:PAS domain S-box-containing protein
MKDHDKTKKQLIGELTELRRQIDLHRESEATQGQIDNKLRENEEKYRLLFENANDAIFLMREDGFVECNPKTLEIFGCTWEQIIGKPPYNFSPPFQPDGRESKEKALEKARAAIAGEPQCFDWKHCRYDGTLFDAEVSLSALRLGDKVLTQAIVRDTTERRRSERALQESEELHRAVVESVADGIAVTVDTDRVFVNKGFLEIHGLKEASQVLGLPLDQFIFEEDRETVKDRVLARQRGESIDELVEYRIRRTDGEIRTVQASAVTIEYKGEPAILAVLRDITPIKKAEMEILRLNRELEQHVQELRDANEELETFNSTVSHDLRLPLIALNGLSRKIVEKYAQGFDEKLLDYMSVIRRNVTRMEQLIEDLLAYSRVGKGAMGHSAFSMEELAVSVMRDLGEIYPDGEISITSLPPSVGDERMIRQVLTNLFSNAFKFTRDKQPRTVEMRGWAEAEENVYCVSDNGAGFDMLHKEKLFNVFQRLHTSDQFEGTGVGLAIVKRIVTLHGGRVWAEGKPGLGATFYFTLPRAPNHL